MTDWSSDMSKAPRGYYDVRATSRGKGHVKPFIREPIIAASACGIVTVSYYIPDEKRWNMFTADHPPIAWMPYTGPQAIVGTDGKTRTAIVLPAHPSLAESWFDRALRRAA